MGSMPAQLLSGPSQHRPCCQISQPRCTPRVPVSTLLTPEALKLQRQPCNSHKKPAFNSLSSDRNELTSILSGTSLSQELQLSSADIDGSAPVSSRRKKLTLLGPQSVKEVDLECTVKDLAHKNLYCCRLR